MASKKDRYAKDWIALLFWLRAGGLVLYKGEPYSDVDYDPSGHQLAGDLLRLAVENELVDDLDNARRAIEYIDDVVSDQLSIAGEVVEQLEMSFVNL